MKTKLVLFVSLLVLVFLSLDGVKNVLSKEEDKNVKGKAFTIESDIAIVPDGDEKKNNEVDAGDIVRFTYTLINTTDNNYMFGILKTNIDSKQISFIHNIHGATGIINDNKTVEIPYVRLNSGETVAISFDALINYFQEDKTITTEAEFVTSDKKSIVKAKKQEVVARKLSAKEIDERGISLKKQ